MLARRILSIALSLVLFSSAPGRADTSHLQEARLTASDGAAADQLGISVAASGDTIVVGALGDDGGRGAAYVFLRPAGGWGATPVESAKLIASDRAVNDQFGIHVAVSGDVVVVGARFDDAGVVDQGSVYVFVKPSGGWRGTLTEQAKLTASDAAGSDFLGTRVDVSGDVIVAGAPNDNIGANGDQGSAYLFVRPADGWSGALFESAKLVASGGAVADQFGIWVGVDGDTVAVGAGLRNVGANADQGTAYVFVEPAGGWGGTLTENARLVASDGAALDNFGRSVAVSGDTIVVGALFDDIGGNANQGSAYIFVEPAGGWTGVASENAKLTASDGAAGDSFGTRVAISGDAVVVGANEDDVTAANQGSAYVFARPPDGWSGALTQDEKLVAADGALEDQLGISVAVSGRVVVAGAWQRDVDGRPNQGAAYVFARPLVASQVAITPPSAENPVGTTHAVTATVNTVDGEGVPGVIVRFDVTGAATASGACTTSASGACDFSYAGPTSPGDDTIAAFADTNGDGVNDPEEPRNTASKTWLPAAPARVRLDPPTAQNPVGTSHTVMASVVDAFLNPTPGVVVRFFVTGGAIAAGSCVTGAGGQCTFAYVGPTAPGSDTILAFADTDGDGAQDPGEPAGGATKEWVQGEPAMVTVTPEHATNPVATEHCVEADVVDSFGNAVAGVTVRFVVTGSVAASGAQATGATGRASFCYTGPELPGADDITAHADTDGDGVRDAGEPTGGATKSWLLPESTPGQSSGGGHVPGPNGEIAFGFNAKNQQGALRGNCNVIDRAAGVHVKCLGVTSFVVSGTHVQVFGPATVNDVNTTYRIDATDLAEPGEGEDVFMIATQSGYEAGGLLVRGNVQVR